jgi:hypothetical protein
MLSIREVICHCSNLLESLGVTNYYCCWWFIHHPFGYFGEIRGILECFPWEKKKNKSKKMNGKNNKNQGQGGNESNVGGNNNANQGDKKPR